MESLHEEKRTNFTRPLQSLNGDFWRGENTLLSPSDGERIQGGGLNCRVAGEKGGAILQALCLAKGGWAGGLGCYWWPRLGRRFFGEPPDWLVGFFAGSENP